ncbi:MAG: hypothetical protein HGA31_03165 [Candidatus Moranbacteria bacterium]|nr:hypothetical protein [Candidatus Moranbacteria bacterium]
MREKIPAMPVMPYGTKDPEDPSRRKFLKTLGAIGLGSAIAGTGLGVFVEGTDRHFRDEEKRRKQIEDEEKARKIKERLELQKIAAGENPMDTYFRAGSIREIGQEQFEKAVEYWAARYEVGKDAERFRSAVEKMAPHFRTMKSVFEEKEVPPALMFVSIYESFWDNESWGHRDSDGPAGPFQLMRDTAKRMHVGDRTDWHEASQGAAKLLSDMIGEMDGIELFGVLKYNGTFVGKFLQDWKSRNGDARPTVTDFYSFMSHKAAESQSDPERLRGMRINAEYLVKFLATIRTIGRIDDSEQKLEPIRNLCGDYDRNVNAGR